MGGFSGGFSLRFVGTIALLIACGPDAKADKIGGSSLPSTTPALKGRIADETGATSAIAVYSNVGFSSNAGPTLEAHPSPFVDRGIGHARIVQTPAGRVDFNIDLSERRYTAFEDANEWSGRGGLALTRDWGGQQSILAVAFSKGRDVEERPMDASLTAEHAWTDGTIKPYVKFETALLDYGDVPADFYPFGNQDDRDRISSRVQAALRLTLTEHVTVEGGAGVDSKIYLKRYDDFGLRRDSVSAFPLLGVAISGDSGSLRAVYMPFLRHYEEGLFEEAWKHGYIVEGNLQISERLKAFGLARYGFEETDFLVASSAYESVFLAGLTLSLERGSLSFSASETARSYDGLDLIDLDRDDRKFEIALAGEMPLVETISLSGRISYMDYMSSLGAIRTDMLTASVGLTYVFLE